jgi:hypothetical protein
MSPEQLAGQNVNIKIGNMSFETVEQFRYLRKIQIRIPFVKKLRAN